MFLVSKSKISLWFLKLNFFFEGWGWEIFCFAITLYGMLIVHVIVKFI